MNKIKILPEDVRKKIAAGEVVESPFSVVKELIENSLDAKASEIEVQVFDSGLKKILVKDNGEGILKDDLKLATQVHATSKINDVYDIEKISSYGFRGEALASISSVSDFLIFSKSQDEESGARLEIKNNQQKIEDYLGSQGTTIIVENLFYNIPARKKFLKSKAAELRYIREIFLKMALVNPQVGFLFSVDGQRKITLNQTTSLKERVKQIYKEDFMEGLYYDQLQDLKVNISGFFSKPIFLKSTRSYQQLFINKRPIDYKYLGFLLSKAYEAIAVGRQYPVGIIFLEIPSELVDVNIHPAKREVKLFDQKYIDSLIISLARQILNQTHSIPHRGSSFLKDQFSEESSSKTSEFQGENNLFKPGEPESKRDLSTFSNLLKNKSNFYKKEIKTNEPLSSPDSSYQFMGVAFHTYLVIQQHNFLYYIDFHAAHEKIIYDSLINKPEEVQKQELLFPLTMTLSHFDYQLLLDNRLELAKIGFEIDDFGDQTIKIQTVPVVKGKVEAEKIIKNFLELVHEERENDFSFREKMISSIACQTAKKAGDHLTVEEIDYIVEQIFKGDHETRCPHGRPFLYKIEKNDLARLFKRQ